MIEGERSRIACCQVDGESEVLEIGPRLCSGSGKIYRRRFGGSCVSTGMLV